MTKINDKDVKDLSELTRLIVLVELEPLSDRYVQVVLPHEAFSKISNAAFECQPTSKNEQEGEERKTIMVRPMRPVRIPDMQDFYDPIYIETLKQQHFGKHG